MKRQGTLMAIVAAAILPVLLAGCNDKPTATGTPPAGTSNATATTAAKKELPTGGKCVLLAPDRATTLLGGTPKSSAAAVSGGDGVVHVDGCAYTGTDPTLGYDINDYAKAGVTPKTIIQQAKAAMAQAPAQPFDAPGADDSVAFTMAVGPKTMARIEAAKGNYTVAVNAVGSDPAKAKQVALDALAILIAALG